MAVSFSELVRQYLDRFLSLHPEASQATLARQIGVTRATLSHWKNGVINKPARDENILALAALLNLTRTETAQLFESSGYAFRAEDAEKFSTSATEAADAMLTWAMPGRYCPEFVVDRPYWMDELYRAVISGRSVKKGLWVYGVGGTGKTTLLSHMVMRFAEEVQKAFPDGLVWINFENTLVDPLTQIAVQLGLPNPPCSDLAARQAVFFQVRNRKILWVLDGGQALDAVQTWVNFVQEAQGFYILALQECPDPAWLLQRRVTSLHLGDLTRDESLGLTEKILGAPLQAQEIPVWDAVADWVGHHPLSLRILAGIASFDPTQERWKRILADLNQRGTTALQLRGMSGAEDKDLSVNASFSVSYQHVEKREPGAAACFRAIGILACAQFSPSLITALLGSEEKAIRMVSILAQSGLLDLIRNEGQYRIHRITHAFAKTMLAQNEQECLLIKQAYVSAVAAISVRERNLPLDWTSGHLWREYLHAMEIAQEIYYFRAMLEIINNIYDSALMFGQAEPVFQRARKLLALMKSHQDLFKGQIPFLHNIIGDILRVRMQLVPAKEHFSQTLLLTDNPSLRIRALLQRAICAFLLDDFTHSASDLDAADRMIKTFGANISEDIIEDFKDTRNYIFPNDADPVDETRSRVTWVNRDISKLRRAAHLIDEGDYKVALPLLERMTALLANQPGTVLYWEASLLLAEGYLKAGHVIQAEAALASIESAITNECNIDELNLLPARFWHLRSECARQKGDFNTEIMHATKLFGMLGRRALWLAEQRDQFDDENEPAGCI